MDRVTRSASMDRNCGLAWQDDDCRRVSSLDADETCHWLYEGCSIGICMCDPLSQKKHPHTGRCIPGDAAVQHLYRARRYAIARYLPSRVCLFVRHKPVLYRNDWTNLASFGHGCFLPPILRCVLRKSGISENKCTPSVLMSELTGP